MKCFFASTGAGLQITQKSRHAKKTIISAQRRSNGDFAAQNILLGRNFCEEFLRPLPVDGEKHFERRGARASSPEPQRGGATLRCLLAVHGHEPASRHVKRGGCDTRTRTHAHTHARTHARTERAPGLQFLENTLCILCIFESTSIRRPLKLVVSFRSWPRTPAAVGSSSKTRRRGGIGTCASVGAPTLKPRQGTATQAGGVGWGGGAAGTDRAGGANAFCWRRASTLRSEESGVIGPDLFSVQVPVLYPLEPAWDALAHHIFSHHGVGRR